MYINDLFYTAGPQGLSSSVMSTISPAMGLELSTGEIHITTSEECLVFALFDPRRGVNGQPATEKVLERSGLTPPFVFADLHKVVFAPHMVALYPKVVKGQRLGRKRTLAIRNNWIGTNSIYFSSWSVLEFSDTARAFRRDALTKHQSQSLAHGVRP